MPVPADIEPGLYNIISYKGPAGVHNSGPTPDETVRINQTHKVWRIKRRPSGDGYRLSICKFPYTGAKGCSPGSEVIVTNDEHKDIEWFFVKRDEDKYTIHPKCDGKLVWTLSNEHNRESPITLHGYNQLASQLFELVKVDQDDCQGPH